MPTILSLTNGQIKFRAKTIFENINFQWEAGQHWAIVGSNGSGKSALLQTLAGKFIVADGSLSHPFADAFREEEKKVNEFFTYHDLIQLVDVRHAFKNKSNTKDFYYQQRYNVSDADNTLNVSEYLQEQYTQCARHQHWTLDRVKSIFGLEKLWDKSLLKLSNGESKRLRLASVLLKNPVILMLDNLYTGLDSETRISFNNILTEIAKNGTAIIVVTTPYEVPDVVTNVLVMDECKCLHNLPKSDFDPDNHCPDKTPKVDFEVLQTLLSKPIPPFESIVDLKNATIRYGDTVVLENISWKICAGERWTLTGINGSGKSTLISLLNGDHPQAYACDLTLFDKKRGSRESIWEIKRHIGFMSPEFYQFFPSFYTCKEIVISGFYEALGTRKTGTEEEQRIAKHWLDLMNLTDVQNIVLSELSASQQRACLLARALVKVPTLLILDEPCQGLDHQHQEQFRQIIDTIFAHTKMTLIYVTHYQEELPTCINKTKRLG